MQLSQTARSSAESQGLARGTGQPGRIVWSPLLLEACPKGWVKVGFGARALDGDQKRKSLRLGIPTLKL